MVHSLAQSHKATSRNAIRPQGRFMQLPDIHDANSLVERDLWFAFKGNVIVWLLSKPLSVSLDAIVILINPYY